MPPIPDDPSRPNPLTESVPRDLLLLSDDLAVGLEHPTTDDDLECLLASLRSSTTSTNSSAPTRSTPRAIQAEPPSRTSGKISSSRGLGRPSSRVNNSHVHATPRTSDVTRDPCLTYPSHHSPPIRRLRRRSPASVGSRACAPHTHHSSNARCPSDDFESIGEPGQYGPKQMTWYPAFQFRPPERAPRLDGIERQLERIFDDADIYHEGPCLDIRIWHN